MTNSIKIAGGITLVAGLWLMFSAFMLGVGIYSSLFVVGVILAVLALIELSSMESASWVGWLSGALGFWLLISPLALTMMTIGEFWNSIILGLVVLVSAIWGAMSSTSSMGHGHPRMG